MNDPFEKVDAGQPLNIQARTWNAILDSARGYARAELGRPDPPQIGALPPASVQVHVQNTTGETLPQFSVVKVSGTPLISAVAAPNRVNKNPVLPGATPTGPKDAFAITIEPITPDRVGAAIGLGYAVCDLVVNSDAHEYAAPGTSTAALQSRTSGPARILWKNGTSGTVRAVVLLGGGTGTSSSGNPDCNGDGWLIAAKPDDYWTVQEIGSGNAPVAITQKITVNEIEYTVSFDPAVPSLSLTPDLPSAVAIVGRKDCSVCPCVTFAFRRKSFYPDFVEDADDVCSRVLYFKVCASCPAGWYCTRPKNSPPGTPYTPLELEAGEACSGELDVQSGGPWESEEEAEEHCSACPPNMGLPCCTSWSLPWDMKAGDVAWHVYDRIASSSPPSVTNCLTINGTGTVNVWYGPSKGCTGMTQFVFNSPRTCISIPPFDFLVNRIIYIEFTATVDGPATGDPTWFTGICNCFNEEQMCPEDVP